MTGLIFNIEIKWLTGIVLQTVKEARIESSDSVILLDEARKIKHCQFITESKIGTIIIIIFTLNRLHKIEYIMVCD